MLEILDDEKANFSKENNYIQLMDMLLQQKKQLDSLRSYMDKQENIINQLQFGI